MQVTSTDETISLLPAAPEGFCPEGVPTTYFDKETLYLIEHAIPPHLNGLKIFAHLLYYGTIHPKTCMQYSILQATGETQDEVIILIRSVDTLAKSPGSPCGPETYLKVILIFEALKIIRRIFHRNYTEIRIAIGKREIHIPSLLKELHHLHDTYQNNKVKQIAKKVAKRLQSGEFSTYQSASLPVTPDLVSVAQILVSLLNEHGVEHVQVSRLAVACTSIASAVQTQRVSEKKGEFIGERKDGSWHVSLKKGELNTQLGEFSAREEEQGLFPLGMSQTLLGEFMSTESPKLGNPGMHITTHTEKSCPKRFKRGDLDALFTVESPDSVPVGSVLTQMGEFKAVLSINDHYFSSNITKGDIALNDDTPPVEKQVFKDPRPIEEIRREAVDYADLLDGKGVRDWMGKLIESIQDHPAHIRHLAVIDTLFFTYFPDWRKKPRAPGAWFSKACDRFDVPDVAIPEPVRLWAETGLSYVQIESRLQQGSRVPMEVPLSTLEETEITRDEGSLQVSEPLYTAVDETWQSSRLRTRMNTTQAEALKRRIEREGAYYGIIATVGRGDQGSSVVVTTWGGEQETHVNEGEWDEYFTAVKPCLE